MARLTGKTVLVTGGALGIGRATCLRMAESGARIAVADTRDAEGQAVVDAIVKARGVARYWHLDVNREADVRAVVSGIHGTFGRLDVLVNTVGDAGPHTPAREMSGQDWDALMKADVKGAFYCTKHVVPIMVAARAGSIVNLSSIYGLSGAADAPVYHASRNAVRLMTRTDALLYAKHGIRVNAVHPGLIATSKVESFLQSLSDPIAGRKTLDARHPLGHVGQPDDVAWGVVYLASDEARFVTGTEIVIDGGYSGIPTG